MLIANAEQGYSLKFTLFDIDKWSFHNKTLTAFSLKMPHFFMNYTNIFEENILSYSFENYSQQ